MDFDDNKGECVRRVIFVWKFERIWTWLIRFYLNMYPSVCITYYEIDIHVFTSQGHRHSHSYRLLPNSKRAFCYRKSSVKSFERYANVTWIDCFIKNNKILFEHLVIAESRFIRKFFVRCWCMFRDLWKNVNKLCPFHCCMRTYCE